MLNNLRNTVADTVVGTAKITGSLAGAIGAGLAGSTFASQIPYGGVMVPTAIEVGATLGGDLAGMAFQPIADIIRGDSPEVE